MVYDVFYKPLFLAHFDDGVDVESLGLNVFVIEVGDEVLGGFHNETGVHHHELVQVVEKIGW